MRLVDGRLTLSPSDLSGYLACPHLTTLELLVARGELARPHLESPHRDLIFRKGNEREAAYLASLDAAGRTITRIPTLDDPDFDADEARRLTEEAIATRAVEVIYQPYLVAEDGAWRGFADFLELQPGGAYEPVDTKLARSAKPAHLLQLLFYAEQVERLQGASVERVHVQNGRGERETFRVAEFEAHYRRVRGRFLDALAASAETYPWPCGHCGICDFRHFCRDRLVEDDHLTLVAGMRRTYAETLMEAGVATLEALGDLRPDGPVGDLRPETLEALRHQAELQLRARRNGGVHCYELLPDEADRGFRLLPEPDEGDVWFDIEGHPFYEPARGLEYLFGYCYRAGGRVVYEALWARDRESERDLFERFVDWVVERRRRYPGMHVYHYASYERTALTRLMGEHGTRENEVDDFLRREVLIDLYRVVKQSLRASTDSSRSRRSRRCTGSRAPLPCPAGTSPSSASRSGSRRATTRSSSTSSATTRRTAARSTSCTNGCSGSGPTRCRGARRPSCASVGRRRRSATPIGPRFARGCSTAPRRGSRGACSRTCSTTTAASSGRSGGRGSAGRSSTPTSSSATAPPSAGSSTTNGRRRSRGAATPTG